MPLPRRLDTSEGLFERWWSRHRLWPKLPACGILGFVVLFGLWEHAHVVRYSAARPSQAVPSMNLGWQSGFAAYSARPETALPASTAAANATANNTDADSSAASGTEQSNGGWLGNAIAEEWDPFVPNMAPLVEVTAKSCMWPPSVYDACVPDSSLREDAERGKWVRVEKDLNLRAGIYYTYLFYRRLRQRAPDAATVREFRLLTDKEHAIQPLKTEEGWHRIEQNLRAGIWPLQEGARLYYRTAARTDSNLTDEVTEMDIVWGSGGTLFGWDRLGKPFAEPKEKDILKDKNEGAELMWRKGTPTAPQAPRPLAFSAEGGYKIVQIADLHFSVGKGKCKSSDWAGCDDPRGSDLVSLDWLGEVLDAEKPDLVILSGDQLDGGEASFSAESVLLKVAKLFEKRKIPWAAVMGNHDSYKTTLTRYGQFVMMQALPYFVGEPGPEAVDGQGNYFIPLVSADESRTHLFSLYFLDSHTITIGPLPWNKDYGFIKKSQVEWFRGISNSVKLVQRPYRPAHPSAPASSQRHAVKRQDALGTKMAKPNAMAIFHIPLAEVYDMAPDMDRKTGAPLVFGALDSSRGAARNDEGHFFENGIMAQTELGSRLDAHVDGSGDVELAELNDSTTNADAKPEIKLIINGHCHVSDECRRMGGTWSCFSGGSSYSGYSENGFDRRVRVIQLEDYGETIRTYKIVDAHAPNTTTSEGSQRHKIDELVLVGPGAPE